MSNFVHCIEYIDNFRNAADCLLAAEFMAEQEGLQRDGIAILSPQDGFLRLQAFFEYEGQEASWLPDGCHVRMRRLRGTP